MAAGKEIRTKIKSVENTRKITKAMEMVAAAKMRKAQERMKAARPYAEKIAHVATHLAYAHPEYKHPFVIAARQRQACRPHRHLVRQGPVRRSQHQRPAPGGEPDEAVGRRRAYGIDVTAIGNKGLGFMQRLGANVVSQLTGLGDTPHMEKLIGPVKIMLDAYRGRPDRRALHRLQPLRQHDEAGADVEPVLPLKQTDRCRGSQPENATGTTSTNRMPSRWSMAC